MNKVEKPTGVARATQEQTMWWRWTLGTAGIFALVIIVSWLLGNPWQYINSLPRITVSVLLLASNGAFLLRGERLKCTSQEEYERYQRGKSFVGKQGMTWREHFLAKVDGLE
jgi:hypothetical protein